MPKECGLCAHVRREEINKALEAGSSTRDVARTYGVSKSAAARHLRNCLPGIKARARERRAIERNLAVVPAEDRSPFIARVEDHTFKMELVRDSAIRRNDDKTAIAAAREVRGAYEVLGKANGGFQPMFGPAEHRPLFVLPSTAHIHIDSGPCRLCEAQELRNVTPSTDQRQVIEATATTSEIVESSEVRE